MKGKTYRDTFCIFQSIIYTLTGLFLLNISHNITITSIEVQISIFMFLIGAIMYVSYILKTVELNTDKLVIKGIKASQHIEFTKIAKVILSKEISTARLAYKQDIHMFEKDNNKKIATISCDLIGRSEIKEFIKILIKKSGATLEEKRKLL